MLRREYLEQRWRVETNDELVEVTRAAATLRAALIEARPMYTGGSFIWSVVVRFEHPDPEYRSQG